MGSSIFGLTEELELGTKFIQIGKQTESKIFIIASFIIFILKMCNIITIYQFFSLFICYIFWLNCNIIYNRYDYNKIEKNIYKMN